MTKKQNLLEKICSYFVTILSFVIFGYIGIESIFHTSVIDENDFVGEKILFNDDDLVINFFLIAAFFVVIFALRRFADVFKRVDERILMAALAVYTLTLGFIWIYTAQSIPAADSGTVYDAAVRFLKDDWTPMVTSNNDFYNNYSYFEIYPFQLGFVFISEIVYGIFGGENAMAMQVFNVIALALLYVGLLAISKRIFHSKAVTFILTFLLAGCLQAIFFTSFTYGNIIGFSASVWACYFVICFMQYNGKELQKYLLLIPAALLMALGLLAKYNSLIWLAAICIGIAVYVLKTKRWVELLSIVFIAGISIGAFNLVIKSYESRSGVELGGGVGQWLYLDAGIQESSMAPGWYNDISKLTYVNNNCDSELANKTAKESISKRIDYFNENTDYAIDFFNKKILSQWNEPSYESIWVSQVKAHYNGEVEPDTFLNSVYNENWGNFFEDYFDFFQMIAFILCAAGMLGLIINKCSAEAMIPIATLLGGFFYHLLFEAKSQYIMTYFILVLLFSAYGLYFIIKKRNFVSKTADGKISIGERIIAAAQKLDN
ncbi:MAG: hypothetical protein IJV39_02650 [Ruminococcus sp.]|nr:hypothetical protein [Ruminococcus sp.]